MCSNLFAHVNRLDKINPPYHNVFNPFLQALWLDQYKISLNKDSARVKLYDGQSIDIFIKDKRLWNLRVYNKDNELVPCGDFKNGTGKIYINYNTTGYSVELVNGLLEDSVCMFSIFNNKLYLRHARLFKEGLLDGKSYTLSFYSFKFVSNITIYNAGMIQVSEGYGRRKLIIIPTPLISFLKYIIKEPDKMCSKTIYGNGKIISHECFVKKCRNCGI